MALQKSNHLLIMLNEEEVSITWNLEGEETYLNHFQNRSILYSQSQSFQKSIQRKLPLILRHWTLIRFISQLSWASSLLRLSAKLVYTKCSQCFCSYTLCPIHSCSIRLELDKEYHGIGPSKWRHSFPVITIIIAQFLPTTQCPYRCTHSCSNSYLHKQWTSSDWKQSFLKTAFMTTTRNTSAKHPAGVLLDSCRGELKKLIWNFRN